MKLWIGASDDDWFEFLTGRPDFDEVNFWQPSGSRAVPALAPGEPFLFELHAPNRFRPRKCVAKLFLGPRNR